MSSKKLLFCLIAFLTVNLRGANSQSLGNHGINFEEGMSLSQITEKARAQQKFIFVDLYATWCSLCKQMDQEIYSLDSLGKLTNDHFISVKIQIDRTSSDDNHVKAWYTTADSLVQDYSIKSLPALLFFSPEGVLVEKEEGFKSGTEFIDLLRNAFYNRRGYIDSVLSYNRHELALKGMGKLALEAKGIGDNQLANNIAFDYKTHFLNKLLESSTLLTNDNLQFISVFPNLIHSDDSFFKVFYEHGTKVDSMANWRMGFASDLVKYVIANEEIRPLLYDSTGRALTTKPNWKIIYRNISSKYTKQYAAQLVPDAKLSFYRKIDNWTQYANVFDDKVKKRHPTRESSVLGGYFGDLWALDANAWDVFLHCNNKYVLKKALDWIDLAINLWGDPGNFQFIDTKANILYKLGELTNAIHFEEEADRLANHQKDIESALNKMKQGLPTWIN